MANNAGDGRVFRGEMKAAQTPRAAADLNRSVMGKAHDVERTYGPPAGPDRVLI